MSNKVQMIDDERLGHLLDLVYDAALICPPPFDYNNTMYEGRECPDCDCRACWRAYLECDQEIGNAIVKRMEYGKHYRGHHLDELSI